MNLIKKKKIPYYVIFLSIIFCLILGIWWLYLLSNFAHLLQKYVPNPDEMNKLYTMIIAEGSTFIILLNIVLLSTFLLLKKEHSKYTTLQKFYAIFSHELKTPLTTLQLQLEVLPDMLKKSPLEISKIDTIIQRMNDSSLQLKYEVEKMLSLSQLELAPNYQLEKIDFLKFLNQWREKQIISPGKIHLKIDENSQYIIKGNYNLLETIFNNLIRNSLKHSTPNTNIEITAKNLDLNKLIITYNDFGEIQKLNSHKLGNLFYKSPNSNGSGLGLFIIKQMAQLMKGSVYFNTEEGHLKITLTFQLDI